MSGQHSGSTAGSSIASFQPKPSLRSSSNSQPQAKKTGLRRKAGSFSLWYYRKMSNLIDVIENGDFNNLGKPERIIETLLSKLFFFGDDVYKVYKSNKAFFGDFSDGLFRKSFYNDDFIWNNTMAPDVYIKLGRVKEEEGVLVETSSDDAEDYYILMKKIDDTQTLFNLIKSGGVKKEDLEFISSEMYSRVQKLTEKKKEDMSELFNTSYVDLDLKNLGTTREWLRMAPELISDSEADSIIETLRNFVSTSLVFKDFNTEGYFASIDNHTGNILFYDDKVNFIDSMPPMDIWRVQNPAYVISRPATDLEVLIDKEHADIMFAKFEECMNAKIDPKMKAYLQINAALIQAPYLCVLKENDYAQKFWDFAKFKALELN